MKEHLLGGDLLGFSGMVGTGGLTLTVETKTPLCSAHLRSQAVVPRHLPPEPRLKTCMPRLLGLHSGIPNGSPQSPNLAPERPQIVLGAFGKGLGTYHGGRFQTVSGSGRGAEPKPGITQTQSPSLQAAFSRASNVTHHLMQKESHSHEFRNMQNIVSR